MSARPTLSAEMLLFEIAAICSRHGIPVRCDNPVAALYHAGHLLQALGVGEPPQAIAAAPEPAATTLLPRVATDPRPFERGLQRPGARPVLRTVDQ